MTELFETFLIKATVCQDFDKAIVSLVFAHAKFSTRNKRVTLALGSLRICLKFSQSCN